MKITVELNEEEARSFFNWRVINDQPLRRQADTMTTPPRITTPKTQHHKRKRHYAPWTKEEVKALRRHYTKFTRHDAKKIRYGRVKTIAKRLHRTPAAIIVKACELGFNHSKGVEA